MAFALQFDGINDYVSVPSWSASGDFDISGSFTTPATIGTQIILGSSSSNNHFLATFAGGSLQARINGTNLTPAITGLVGSTTYDYTLVRVGSSVTLTVTGVGSQGYTNAGTFVLDAFGRYGSGLYFSGQIPGTLTMIGSGGTRTYDFNQSTGSVLPDTTSSQDGTLTNFPTDDSQWVDIGGGGPTYTLTANNAAFTTSGQSSTLSASRLLAASPAPFTTSGQGVSLLAGRVLAASHAAFTTNGQAVGLLAGRALAADHAAFTTTGQSVTMTYSGDALPDYALTAEPALFTTTPQAVALLAARLLTAAPAAFTTTGQSAVLTYSGAPGTPDLEPGGVTNTTATPTRSASSSTPARSNASASNLFTVT